MDRRGFRGRHVEHDVKRRRVRHLHERLALIHRRAEDGGHTGDDPCQRGAQRGELLGAARRNRRGLRLGEVGGGLLAVLLRQDPRLHESHRARVAAFGAHEGRGRAARGRVEGCPLELDQGIAGGDPLARRHEDPRHAGRPRGRQDREPPRPGTHDADGGEDLRERLLGRHGGGRGDARGRLLLLGRPLAASSSEGGQHHGTRREESHG